MKPTSSTRRRFLQAGSAAGLGLAFGGLAPAQAAVPGYPSKPMRIIVGFAPGGGNDALARIIAQKLSISLGKPVIVENRPGAAGTIGANAVARADPDGHTLLLGSVSNLVIGASTMSRMPFDPEKDFAPVILTARMPLVLVVQPSLRVNSVAELVGAAKARPDALTYASGGNGVANDLAGGLFNQMTGTEIRHIPYSGDGPGIAALLAGQVSMMYAVLPAAVPHIRSGALKALAVDMGKRVAALPEVPTFAEAGLPGYEINLWNGILATGGTPPEVVQLLNEEIRKILDMPDVSQQMVTLGFERVPPSREQFAALIKSDSAKWPPLVNKLGRRAN
jgi:tripartite-type tricarboxylate transporter receptor subunit TctC